MAPISIHSVHFSFWYQKEWWKITFHISSKWLWFRSFVLPFCLISITKSVFKKLKRDNYSILSLCMFEKLFDKPGKTAKIRNADNGFISCSGACKLWALCPPLPSICERCVPPPLVQSAMVVQLLGLYESTLNSVLVTEYLSGQKFCSSISLRLYLSRL